MIQKRPHRQICGLCHREYAIDYHVPNEIWEAAVHPGHVNDLHCLNCFIERADAQLLSWDKYITFEPTSLRTHLEQFPIEEDDYWKKRCEAAEALINGNFFKADAINLDISADAKKYLREWQSLKNQRI